MTDTRQQIEWALAHWLKCPGLDVPEEQVVRHLYLAAVEGLVQFDAARAFICHSYFPVLLNAIAKARREGVLKTWPTEAPI